MNSTREYLESYRELQYNLQFYRSRMQGIKAITYSSEARSTVMHNDLHNCLEQIERIEKEMGDIESFIERNYRGLDRIIMWKRYIEHFQSAEIAEHVNMSVSYVTKRISTCVHSV